MTERPKTRSGGKPKGARTQFRKWLAALLKEFPDVKVGEVIVAIGRRSGTKVSGVGPKKRVHLADGTIIQYTSLRAAISAVRRELREEPKVVVRE